MRGYRPLTDYALIGDGRTAVLVARDGAIDWGCWPRFDGKAAFCRLLDARTGGWFRVGPAGGHDATRAYVGETNVLATTFASDGGRVRVTDLMPAPASPSDVLGRPGKGPHHLVRLVEGLAGAVELEVAFHPTFDYARADTEVTARPGGAVARAGAERLALRCPVGLAPDGSGTLAGRVRVRAGERFWVTLAYGSDPDRDPVALSPAEAETALERTLAYWLRWSAACTYEGPYHPLVRRSALTLALLTFAPTGAIVAAPTTSLPEEVGGVRNWDYRYTWLRDASLILYALQSIGYHAEADRFFAWVERLCLHGHGELRIAYAVDGGEELHERTLDHLEGYRGSRPVRVGNAAADQTQLDVYGAVLDAAHTHFSAPGRPVEPSFWTVLAHFADQASSRWREPDQGIWEVRGGPRHFLYSKLLCWVAVDRAIRLADARGLPANRDRWHRARSEIRRAILEEGYDAGLGAFTQALGEPTLDASALAIPQVGFLPATDPRVRSTIERIRERLTSRGLVYRYRVEEARDGLPGGEATFALCSFWLVDNLALSGRPDDARALFERVVGHANDVGLLAEEIEPATGELLGNFPQGFSHLALIQAALDIARAEAQPRRTASGGRLPRA